MIALNVHSNVNVYFNISDALIGVHCTHGVNRTGYLICRYLIEKLDWDPQKAIDGKVINSIREKDSSLDSSHFELKPQWYFLFTILKADKKFFNHSQLIFCFIIFKAEKMFYSISELQLSNCLWDCDLTNHKDKITELIHKQ